MLNVTYDCGKLNIIPGVSIPPVVHCSFGDAGVKINFQIYKGKTIFPIPDGTEAVVYGVRADGANWGPIEAKVDMTTVSFTLEDVITGFEGASLAEISFLQESDDKIVTIGTANFAIMVESATWFHGASYSDDISTYKNILKYVTKSVKAANKIIKEANNVLDNAVNTAKAEVDNKLPKYFQDWINSHVGTGSDVTDKTLTLENASADAKAAGDKIRSIDENLTPRVATLEAKTSFLSVSMEDMEECCAEVQNSIRTINNFVTIAKALHDPVYLLDTEGNRLLTTDGKFILVSL